ncbi:MAG: ABC transporter permease [Acidobacteria bacterium]|nr:ABC transporter permease [Acidobacteriota bacterium]
MNSRHRTALVSENLAIAMDVLFAHKLRSGLVVLGVAIGVSSLIGMVSILLGLRASIVSEVSSYQQTVLLVQKFDFFVGGFDESLLRRKDIEEEDMRAIASRCKSLSHVAFVFERQGVPPTLSYRDQKSRMVGIVGTQPSLLHIYSLDLGDGRMFTDTEVARGAKVAVLSHSPGRDLFPNTDPIGKKIRINEDEYTIVGVFAERKALGEVGDNFVAIPYTTYRAAMETEMDSPYIMASVRDDVSLEEASDEVIQVMRRRRKLKANEENDFDVTSLDAALDFISRLTAPIALILSAISSIGLLVGGIGIMNIMLVSVTERTNEIGIRKAVGALRKYILLQFLIESGTLTGLGGVLGVSIGLLGALGVSLLTGLPFSLSPLFILLAVFVSISIGVFFGLYPACRASRLDPIKAIGYAK